VLVPADLVSGVRKALPARSVLPYSKIGQNPVDFVVVDRSRPTGSTRGLASILRRSFPVAETTPGKLETRQVVRRSETSLASDLAARTDAGAQLADNPALDIEPPARAALGAGGVDSRLLLMLSTLAASHLLSVEFPADRSAATDAPLRTAWITAVDGVDIDRDSKAADLVLRFLAAQPTALQPAVQRVQEERGRTVLVIRYSLPVPLGFLDDGSLPTIPSS
jgi:hypothetical protein